nr:ST.17 [Starmerella bombicola]
MISVGSTLCGLGVGTLILCANFQFGLQTGWVSMMSMPAALLGFAWFKLVRSAITPQENVYIQSVAVAVGTGPLSFGLVGAIPAIQFLLSEEEGQIDFSWLSLTVWSSAIAFMGIFTALLFRKMIIGDRQLTFPSGSAAAALIGVLHDKPTSFNDDISDAALSEHDEFEYPPIDIEVHSPAIGADDHNLPRTSTDLPGDAITMRHYGNDKNTTYRRNIVALVLMFVLSGTYTVLSKVFNSLRGIPLFGKTAASYMWTFDLSPAYVGQGVIMGLPTTTSMLIGAILGWAVLAPLSSKMGWAPGPIGDWQTGAQGWIMWISLAIMVADTLVSFTIMSVGAVTDLYRKIIGSEQYMRLRGEYDEVEGPTGRQQNRSIDGHSAPEPQHRHGRTPFLSIKSVRQESSSQRGIALFGLLISSLICILCIKLLFGDVPRTALAIAIALSPVLSLLGVRALGETDLNPVSSIAKLTQLIFGVLIRNRPHAVLLNIVAGAITEAGAQQAGDLMQDYKTGNLLAAPMTQQTLGMILGTTWSVAISGLIYKLYTSHFDIPGSEFRIPTAYIWADCARLVTGDGLPHMAGKFSLAFGIIFMILAIAKHNLRGESWSKWIPSGVAVGIGIYNVPPFTIARFIGGVMAHIYQRRHSNPGDEVYMIILSSGLILGEGLMSVVTLLAILK